MKKFLTILVFLFSLTMSAQTPFVSASVSIADGGFVDNSYPSLEAGVSMTNVSVSGLFGRGNFTGAFAKDDVISNYWWEMKVAPYLTMGRVTGSVFMGVGGYINTDHYFTDMGVGLSYAVGDFNYGVAFNRWDEVNYVSPSITYNFN